MKVGVRSREVQGARRDDYSTVSGAKRYRQAVKSRKRRNKSVM